VCTLRLAEAQPGLVTCVVPVLLQAEEQSVEVLTGHSGRIVGDGFQIAVLSVALSSNFGLVMCARVRVCYGCGK
jgi:hypothetical protein